MYRLPICVLSFAFLVVGAVAACQTTDDTDDTDDELTCASYEEDCDGVCIDVENDNENCGACGEECGEDEECIEGSCELDCSSREDECDGACVDLDTDNENCGECDNECATGEQCDDGECVLQCGGDTPDLCVNDPGASETFGCYDSDIDEEHCGCDADSEGYVCGATFSCASGACTCSVTGDCPSGLTCTAGVCG